MALISATRRTFRNRPPSSDRPERVRVISTLHFIQAPWCGSLLICEGSSESFEFVDSSTLPATARIELRDGLDALDERRNSAFLERAASAWVDQMHTSPRRQANSAAVDPVMPIVKAIFRRSWPTRGLWCISASQESASVIPLVERRRNDFGRAIFAPRISTVNRVPSADFSFGTSATQMAFSGSVPGCRS